MAYIEVDLSEIDFDDLLEEVGDRLMDMETVSYRQNKVEKLMIQCAKYLKVESIPEAPNLKDHFKMEFTKELMEKYSEDQLREMEKMYLNKKPR